MKKYSRSMSVANSVTSNGILSNDNLRSIAPSIFATEAYQDCSDKYSFIPTYEIVNSLRQEGFHPFYAAQGRSRIEGKQEFTKHILRFRHESSFGKAKGGFNELVYVNSHDRTSGSLLMGGRFEMVCANGHIIGDIVSEQRCSHVGINKGIVIEGAYHILSDFDKIEDSISTMKEIELNREDAYNLTQQFLSLRWEPGEVQPTVSDFLRTRRIEDRYHDLWTVYNVAQENMLRGGIRKMKNHNPHDRLTSTRPITAIDQTVSLNRDMWNIAERFKMRKLGITADSLL